MSPESNKRPNRERRAPKKATAAYLERAALFYLERYAASADSLRRVLMRKVHRSTEAHGSDPAEGAAAVEALIARFLNAGLLDDGLYARGQAVSLGRRGNSERAIRLKLRQRGVAEPDIAQALTARREESDDPELAAALAYARRRRLGPYRTDPTARTEARMKDLAALARRGFTPALCKRVIDTDDLEELWDETRGGV
ncbi:regulatory protein RecX [Algihabitans albus]|uniref:regulatory protein RecX n=1 Tax=Algihabitans albus TaxID=2164067 RepID=UPI000E5CAD66|nr:RecX family transcriptional regulator [Algihabitans albus]